MGNFLKSLVSMVGTKKECRILLLGLDAAGKTSILNKITFGESLSSVPTIGFNVEKVKYKNLNFSIWDIGGQQKIRDLWQHYYENSDAIIYVLDSSDEERFDEAKNVLACALENENLKQIPLLVFANKQDVSRVTVSKISELLELSRIRGRQWFIQSSCALTGDGLYDGLNWLAKEMKKTFYK